MSDAARLLADLAARGIQVALKDGALSIRAPKGALTEADRQALTRDKAGLLAALQPVAAPTAVDDEFPLTEVQQAYWVGRRSLDLGNIGCHAYREFFARDLDVPRLQTAWQSLIDRHPMLRTSISEEGRQQVPATRPPYHIAVTDLVGAADATARLAEIRDTMSHHTFDPAHWPLFDIRATRVEGGWHVHIGMDLLIADAAGMLQLYREWGALYADPAAILPPTGRPFADYVRNTGRDTAAEARAASYWQPRLADLPGAPSLPLLPAPTGKPHFTRHSTVLSGPEWDGLRAVARREGLTASNLLVAAYADILACWSRHQHFLITLTTFQVPGDYACTVGDFTSTLLLEVDATAPAFIDRARALQRRLADDLDHGGWSGVRVAREAAAAKGEAAQPIPVVFTSALGHRAAGDGALPIAWLGDSVAAITQTPQVWIDHHVIEDGGTLVLSWDVLEDLFPPGLIGDMFAAYSRFVCALATGAAAWQAPLGTHVPDDQIAARTHANDTAAPLPAGLLHQGIIDRTLTNPDRVAIVTPDITLTYGQLLAHATGVAALVRARMGDGLADRLVGVGIDKCWQQVVAVLGVLLAGAAYLPIDPALPPLRRRYLAENGGLSLLLTRSGLTDAGWPDGLDVVALEDVASLMPTSDPGPARPFDLAYVIYTSGSTGEPKGVMIEHGAALNTIIDINRRFGIGADDAVLGLSSLSFDLSVYDIFGVLAAGGRLVLPCPDRLRDPGHWLDLMQRHRVTLWNSVPALLSMLVEGGQAIGPDLRVVMLSGDWIALSLPARARAMAPNAIFYGLGGATEASIWSNWFRIDRVEADWRSIPYGWPLANQRYHILNDALQPAPDGVSGRLFIAGDGLARGYWRDLARTAARFITHPVMGERLYDTGDLARYRPGGCIEFLGRQDNQVKIRGYRIELGEIEAALAAHPQVRDVTVMASGEGGAHGADRRLLAYIVAERPAAPDAGKLARLSAPKPRRPDVLRVMLADGGPVPDRRTIRAFTADPVPLSAIGALLSALKLVEDAGGLRRRYPSAGSTYPVKVWLLAHPGRVAGLEGGLYAYDPEYHDLEPLAPGLILGADVHAPVNRDMAASSAFTLLLLADDALIRPAYGDAARDFSLLEAGYAGQELMRTAAAAGLGLCPIGAIDTAPLPLGPDHEVLHLYVGGLPAAGQGDLVSDLMQWLRDRLPAPLIPDAIIPIPALPLTANGKVDRARLPLPDQGTPAPVADPVSDGLEATIAAIFAEVLERVDIPPNRPLFELGGTSVHVVRIHRRLQAALSREIDIVDLFRFAAVRSLAGHLSAGDGGGGDDAAARGAARRRQRQGGVG